MALIKPIEKEIPLPGGGSKTFVLSRFPAIVGREIIAKYPLSAMPKLGDYAVNEETMLKLMRYVGVVVTEGAEPQLLTTPALVNNHCDDWETLARVEVAMLEYNCSFFGNGKALDFFQSIAQQAKPMLSQMLTDSLAQLSARTKPPSKN